MLSTPTIKHLYLKTHTHKERHKRDVIILWFGHYIKLEFSFSLWGLEHSYWIWIRTLQTLYADMVTVTECIFINYLVNFVIIWCFNDYGHKWKFTSGCVIIRENGTGSVKAAVEFFWNYDLCYMCLRYFSPDTSGGQISAQGLNLETNSKWTAFKNCG